MNINRAIKEARARSKLSQEAVGKLFKPEISRSAVAQWEADGGTVPELERLPILARAFNCTLDELIGAAAPKPGPAIQQDRSAEMLADGAIDVAHAWSALPDIRRELYREMILRDAAMNDVAPHLFTVPVKPSYFKMLSSIRHHHDKVLRQLKLDI